MDVDNRENEMEEENPWMLEEHVAVARARPPQPNPEGLLIPARRAPARLKAER